jgi:hypothetical protein
VATLLLGGFASAHAALTTESCLAKKLKEWGKLRNCQAKENGKALQGKDADPAKCQTKFDEKLAKLTAQATDAAIPCRYGVSGDGTVTDYDTGSSGSRRPTTGACTTRTTRKLVSGPAPRAAPTRRIRRTGRRSRRSWGR